MADLSKLRFNGTDYNVKDASAPLRKFTNYSKTGNLPITSDDTTQTAIGKLEKALDDKINTSAKGTASGVAELDANGKVPSSQLPSYVDDVLEYSAKSSFPATGETGKIYVDTTTNKTYRWSGSAYVEISESLALGETSSTAYRGDRGKAAYDHSRITNGNPHGTTGANTNLTGYSKGSSKDAVAATDTVNAAIAKHENRINANQSNILYALGKTGHNLLEVTATSETVSGVEYTVNKNAITISSNGSNTTSTFVLNSGSPLFKASNNVFAIDKVMPAGATITVRYTDGSLVGFNSGNRNTNATLNNSKDVESIYLYIDANKTINDTIKVMVCTQDDWEVTHEITPYQGVPNYDLTRLEAEDRASLAEVVDSGAKNLVDLSSFTGYSDGSLTMTKASDGTITVTGTVPGSFVGVNISTVTLAPGTYVLTGCPSGGGISSWQLDINTGIYEDRGNGVVFTVTSTMSTVIRIRIATTTSSITKVFKPMLATKAAFGVSSKFVPYRPNYDFVCDSVTIVDITSAITTNTGFTINGRTHVYKQGKHVFGTIVISKDSGTITSSTEIAYMNAYKPKYQWVSMCGFGNASEWEIKSFGYVFVDSNTSGKILVDNANTESSCKYVNIQIDYMIN